MNKKVIVLLFIVFLSSFSGIPLLRSEIHNFTQTTIYVDPLLNYGAVGQTFTINVNIFEVTDLYGYEFRLFYNTTILDGVNVTLPTGHFLTPLVPERIYIAFLEIDDAYNATHGRVLVCICLLSLEEPPKTGSGTLVAITFLVTEAGECVLDLYQTKLAPLPPAGPIPHDEVDGKCTATYQRQPIARFTWVPSKPHVNGTVTFDASNSLPAWNGTNLIPIVRYTWDFGDGTPIIIKTSPIINYNYEVAGTYNVTLNITDVQGFWGTMSKLISVLGSTGPTASFTYSRSFPFENVTVMFIASSSTSGWEGKLGKYSPIVSYEWDFGDGTPKLVETDPITTHVFTQVGTYIVTLNVTDERGWWDATSLGIAVMELLITGPAVYVNPPYYYAKVLDEIFAIEIVVLNISDTIGFEFELGYDTTILDAFNVTLGPFLNEPTFTKTILNETIGSILFAGISLGPATPANGSGVLATITFKVTSVGLCIFDLLRIKLASPSPVFAPPVGPEVPVIRFPVHNVAIVTATPSDTEVYVGQSINITTVAINNGNVDETFQVTVYCGTNVVGTQTISNMPADSEVTLTYSLDTKDIGPYYDAIIKAEASIVADEVEIADNVCINGTVKIKMLGDINGDAIIDIGDVVLWAFSFGNQPGHPNWNPSVDLFPDGLIDVFDGVIIGINFGEEFP